MPRFKSVGEFKKFAETQRSAVCSWIRVGMSTCGIAAGAGKVYDELVEEIEKRNLDIPVKKCGCLGMCYAEPLVEVCIEGMPRVLYGRVDEAVARKIVEEHIIGRRILQDCIYDFSTEKCC